MVMEPAKKLGELQIVRCVPCNAYDVTFPDGMKIRIHESVVAHGEDITVAAWEERKRLDG